MSSSAYATFTAKVTPQSEPIPGEKMVANNTGGFVYEIDRLKVVERFLILGSEGGTYYTKEAKLTKENALATIEAIKADGKSVVDLTVAISDSGRAPKNDPAIFVLALCAAFGDDFTRRYALDNLKKVCRIPTHLFHFATYVQGMRGWGRGLKRAVANWYNDMPVEQLAYLCVKYQSRS